MSSYSRLVVLLFILLLSSVGCANQNNITKSNPEEDLYIMLALDSEKNSDYKNSFKFYKKLFDLTEKEDYLKKTIEYSFRTEQFEQMYKLSQVALKEFPKSKEYFWRQLILALYSLGKTKKAID